MSAGLSATSGASGGRDDDGAWSGHAEGFAFDRGGGGGDRRTTRRQDGLGRPAPRASEQTARVRIARDELKRLRDLTVAALELKAEIAQLVAQAAPQLLTEPGFGPLTAAKLLGEIAGAQRFSSDAKLANAAGLAPLAVSSGKTNRHRLDRGGNRQINAAIHRIAVSRARCHPETNAYLDRKRAEGKTTQEAIRCLKRHLARRIWHLLQPPGPTPRPPSPRAFS